MTAAAITTIGSGNFLNFQSSTIVVRAINKVGMSVIERSAMPMRCAYTL
jgi:hypothetical protein